MNVMIHSASQQELFALGVYDLGRGGLGPSLPKVFLC
jgi:hypothetical protein